MAFYREYKLISIKFLFKNTSLKVELSCIAYEETNENQRETETETETEREDRIHGLCFQKLLLQSLPAQSLLRYMCVYFQGWLLGTG